MVQTEGPAAKKVKTLHRKVALAIVSTTFSEGKVVIDITNDFAYKLEGFGLVVTQRGILFVNEPIIDLGLRCTLRRSGTSSGRIAESTSSFEFS